MPDDIVPLLVHRNDIPRIRRAILRSERQTTGEGVVDTDQSLALPPRDIITPSILPADFEGVMGVVTSPPVGEDEHTDNRYWVEILAPIVEAQHGKRGHVSSNIIDEDTPTPINSNDDIEFHRVTATNLFQDPHHLLGFGDKVLLWQVITGTSISGAEAAGTTRDTNTSTETVFVHWFFFRPIPGLSFLVNCEYTSGSFGTDSVDAAMVYKVTGEKTPVITIATGATPVKARFKKTTYETITGTDNEGLGVISELGGFKLLEVYAEIPKTAVC